MNQLIVSGNLGDEVNHRFTPTGREVTTFDVASNRKYKNANGELVTEVEWTRVETWGPLAKVCAQFLAKGKKVLVIGRKKTDVAVQDDGSKKYYTKLIANSVEFLSPANGENDAVTDNEPSEDEIPF